GLEVELDPLRRIELFDVPVDRFDFDEAFVFVEAHHFEELLIVETPIPPPDFRVEFMTHGIEAPDSVAARSDRRLYLLTATVCTLPNASMMASRVQGESRWPSPTNNAFPVAAVCRRFRANASTRCCVSSSRVGP